MDLLHTYYVPGTVADRQARPSLSSNLPKKLSKKTAASTAAAADSHGARDCVCEAQCPGHSAPRPVPWPEKGTGLVCSVTSSYDTLTAGSLCDLRQVGALPLWASVCSSAQEGDLCTCVSGLLGPAQSTL